jgi:predicted cation transporter
MVFSNDYNFFLANVDKLSYELIDIIYSYIPKSVTIFLIRENYIKEHYLLRSVINKRYTEQYIRTMVRQDNDFVFNLLLVENYNRWLNMKKYYYKECIYGNYINFLESYAIDNKSLKCRKIIIKLFEEQGLNKNQHKKNVIRYIRWTT